MSRPSDDPRRAWLDGARGRPYEPTQTGTPCQPRHGLIFAGAIALGLYWLTQCIAFIQEAISLGFPPSGWFGLAFTTIFYSGIAWYWVWEIRDAAQAMRKE